MFYDIDLNDKAISALNPNVNNKGFLIRFSTVNKDQYYALIYYEKEKIHLFNQYLK